MAEAVQKNPFSDHWKPEPTENTLEWTKQHLANQAKTSLDIFLDDVRSSCSQHASRKGYLSDTGNVAGEMTQLLGIARDHAIGEILYKLLEFRKFPRKVIAVKVAGWAWRLWLEAKD